MAEKQKKILMLCDHHREGKVIPCTAVVEFPVDEAEALVKEGKADDSKAAIAHYEKLAKAAVKTEEAE